MRSVYIYVSMHLRQWALTLCVIAWAISPSYAQDTVAPLAAQEELLKTWQVRDRVRAMGTDLLGSPQLDRMLQLKSELGLESIPEVSRALLQELRYEPQDPEVHEQKLAYALRFSPGSPQVRLATCRLSLSVEALSHCWAAFTYDVSHFSGQLPLLHNLSITLSYAIYLTFIILALIAALYYLESLPSLLLHLIPTLGLPLAASLTASFYILSFAIWGWIGMAALSVLLVWHKLTFEQRQALGSSLILLGFIPLALLGSGVMMHYQTGLAPYLETAGSKLNLNDHHRVLSLWVQNHPQDALAKFGLARIEYRLGNYDRSASLYQSALAIRPNWDKAKHNLALIQFKRGDQAMAESTLKELTGSFRSWKLYFNLSQLALSKTRLDEGRDLLQKAKDIDYTALAYHDNRAPGTDRNIHWVEESLSQDDLKPLVWDIPAAMGLVKSKLHPYFFPRLPLPRFWLFLFVVLVSSMWTGLASIKDIKSLSGAQTRQKSFDIFDPQSSIVQTDHFSNLQYGVRAFLNRWVGILIPGAHLFSRHHALYALFLVTLFSGAASFFFQTKTWMLPLNYSLTLPFAALLLGTYGLSLLNIIGRSDT